MNFFVNKAMGIGNSGVEHAEFYRAKLFKSEKIPYKFLFVDLIPNLHEAMKKWNLKTNEVINMWEYLVFGNQLLKGKFSVNKKHHSELVIDQTNTNRERSITTSSGLRIVQNIVKFPDESNKILMVSVARTRIYDAENNCLKISFENIRDKHQTTKITNIHVYDFEGKHLLFANEVDLRRFFFEKVDSFFGKQSNFIIDRDEMSEVALFNNRIPNSKIIEVIHADHLSDRNDPEFPLWNNYYEYLLTHLDFVDRVIVATKLQKRDLLIDFPNYENKFWVIPVGGVRDNSVIPYNGHKNLLFRVITMSRLASEKHIDLDIKAVCVLHKMGYKITLDIYGQGGEKAALQKIIEDEKARDYIKLKGLTDNSENIYPKYDVFISASFSEGFGLTYIEALNAALPVVTFKARFGALELIRNNINGFLQDYKRGDDNFNKKQLVEGLLKLQDKSTYERIRSNTVDSVKSFQDHVIAKKWRDLINEL